MSEASRGFGTVAGRRRRAVRSAIVALALCASVPVGGRAADDPGLAGFLDAARAADVVILGEIRDNPEHRRRQEEIVRALAPAAIVFETIPQDREAGLNAAREAGGDHAALAQALGWSAAGSPDVEPLVRIMDAAPGARVFGAAQPAAAVAEAAAEGAAEAFGSDAAVYGLDRPLDPQEQAAREAAAQAAQCGAVAPGALAGMVEAGRFRDAGIADATLWARIMTGDGQVVVIAGNAQADKLHGAPPLIALAEPEARIVALGQFEDAPAGAPGAEGEGFDAVLLAPPPPDRADPCGGLRPPGE
ncbi:ChaN family lipoprotein [Amaricoccus sp.]|uniref:ChaN family lipoprotein n=1 Tax=Amaricoccus sp. TaxID=1872485 RepID=UPI001B47E526|nr:ChaN family lipoprotein [Amaricoccus sp.]MBP7001194.1 ChaN family lipoprotein [Amaricoccus sp.]